METKKFGGIKTNTQWYQTQYNILEALYKELNNG